MKTLYLVLFLSVISLSCQKELSFTGGTSSLPTLTTTVVTSVTNTTAISGGDISDDGGAAITARGVCWSTTSNPLATGNHTTDGTGAGTFTSNITGLTATTLYYVRAYATNANGTAYGNEISFSTSATAGALPTVSTAAVTAITATTAAGGGNVLTDGGAAVTARGICWSVSSNPVVTNSHTTDGTGLGNFTSSMTALTASTTYYVRAYATNANGTAYGNEINFTTSAIPGLPTVSTAAISAITATSAAGGGNVLTDGGSTVSARGVCWGTASGPLVSGNHTTDGTGLGAFTSSITSLAAATMYYVRAYATNTNGTAYGNEISFTTSASTGPDVYACGYEKGATKYIAKYWKNGVAFDLTDGTKNASATSIIVVGTDIYISGWETVGPNLDQAIVWKNGVRTNLSSGVNFASASSVFVSGTDVYVSGWEANGSNGGAKYWKNGTSVSLADGGATSSDASGIAVVGSTIYASGTINQTSSSFSKPVMWTNGVELDLPTPASNYAYADGITVNGSDVYVVGYSHDFTFYTVKYWKNGVVTTMPPGPANMETRPSGITVNGTDVYISGWQYVSSNKALAKYWKNGVATDLTNGTFDAAAGCIKIFGTNVYVGGGEANSAGIQVAKYWKNGIATSLTDGTHDAVVSSIFLQ